MRRCRPREIRPRRLRDQSDGLYTEDAREFDAGREALTGKELGPIDSEGLHADEHFPALRYGNRQLLDLKNIRRPGSANNDGLHGGGLATDSPLR